MLKPLLFIIFCCHSAYSGASDELRELRYAEQIESSFATGKVSWLQVKGKKFLSLYTETEEIDSLGTVIILHPMDGHPDQSKLIKPLRTYLPEHGWATLSLQLPVLGIEAAETEYYSLFENANARIQAAIDFLLEAKIKNIVIVGYGLGGVMAVYYLKENANKTEVKGLVTISLAVPHSNQKQAQVIDFIAGIELPFYDIFTDFDLPEVTSSARKRRLAAKENPAYRQVKIAAERHMLPRDQRLVIKRVYSWINRTFR